MEDDLDELLAKLGLTDERIRPVIEAAQAELRTPGRGVDAVVRLLAASAANADLERGRLADRYGEEDERVLARAQHVEAMKALLHFVERSRPAPGESNDVKPMRMKGTLVKDGAPLANATVEIVSRGAVGTVVIRGLTDDKGRFDFAVIPSGPVILGAPEAPDYDVVVRDAAGAEIARSEAVTFKPGKSAKIDLDVALKPRSRARRNT